jgi:predicted nucleic-acid-binding Zn-ribbon protein
MVAMNYIYMEQMELHKILSIHTFHIDNLNLIHVHRPKYIWYMCNTSKIVEFYQLKLRMIDIFISV